MKSKPDGQCARLLNYLMKKGEVHALAAWSELGIYRLSARIYDLRKRGYNIHAEDVTVQNRFGEDCTVKNYKLPRVGQQMRLI